MQEIYYQEINYAVFVFYSMFLTAAFCPLSLKKHKNQISIFHFSFSVLHYIYDHLRNYSEGSTRSN